MRFKDFILEEQTSKQKLNALLDEIYRDCKPFIDYLPYNAPMRGILAGKAGFQQHPTNRKPKDSGAELNFLMDVGFELAFGIEKLRSHSVFVTSNYRVARSYGDTSFVGHNDTMFVFPVGNFECIWSPNVADAVPDSSILYRTVNEVLKKSYSKNLDAGSHGIIWSLLREKFTPQDFISRSENVRRFLNEKFSDFFTTDVYDAIFHALKEGFEKLFVEGNFDEGLEHRVEIMIYESKGYHLIPLKLVEEVMKQDNPVAGTEYTDLWRYVCRRLEGMKPRRG